MITIRQIEALIWSVRLGTLSRAAHRLSIAQPTISKRLQELEDACGFEIFEKRGRNLYLTMRGKKLNKMAEQVFATVLEIENLKNDGSPVERSIAIGVTEFAAHTWVAALVEKIRVEFPHIILRVCIEHCGQLRQKLKSGELDLIVCPSFTHKAEISSLLAQEVKFSIVGSPRDFSSNRQYLGHELSEHTFLTHGSIGTIGAVDTWIADVDWNPKQTVKVDSLVAQIEMARAGMGLAILPAASVATLISAGQLTELKLNKPMYDVLYRIYGRQNELSSSLKEVAGIIKETCDFDKHCQYITERHEVNLHKGSKPQLKGP